MKLKKESSKQQIFHLYETVHPLESVLSSILPVGPDLESVPSSPCLPSPLPPPPMRPLSARPPATAQPERSLLKATSHLSPSVANAAYVYGRCQDTDSSFFSGNPPAHLSWPPFHKVTRISENPSPIPRRLTGISEKPSSQKKSSVSGSSSTTAGHQGKPTTRAQTTEPTV